MCFFNFSAVKGIIFFVFGGGVGLGGWGVRYRKEGLLHIEAMGFCRENQWETLV